MARFDALPFSRRGPGWPNPRGAREMERERDRARDLEAATHNADERPPGIERLGASTEEQTEARQTSLGFRLNHQIELSADVADSEPAVVRLTSRAREGTTIVLSVLQMRAVCAFLNELIREAERR